MTPDPQQSKLLDELARLRRRLTLLDTIVEGTTDAVFAKDREGRYLLMNSTAATFIRRTKEDVLGKDDTEIFPPEVARALMEALV